MFYKGKIEKIDKIVVSDPSYAPDVWCRYECNNAAVGKPWNVQLSVRDVVNTYENIMCKCVEFGLLLSSGSVPAASCELSADGDSFSHPRILSMKKTEIGMDTACIALGINDNAEEILAASDEWQPSCALKTLTDGMFGEVYEGSCYGKTHLVYISGYLDEDIGYSVKDVVRYLAAAFEIKDLQLVQEKVSLNEKIAAADEQVKPAVQSKEDMDRNERS